MIKSIILQLIVLSHTNSYAQDTTKVDNTGNPESNELNIFVDCNFCDNSYFRQNLSHVQFVRDRKVADVHLLFTRQRNGSGGFTQRIQFIGIDDFEHLTDTLSFALDVNMTPDEKRKLQLKYIELGLMRFWIEKGLFDEITFNIGGDEKLGNESGDDPWNYWVF